MIDGFQIKISFLPILKISSMNKTISKLIAKLFLTSLPLIRKIFFSIFFYLQFTVAHGTILRRSEGPWDESVISCHEKKFFFALSSFYFPFLFRNRRCRILYLHESSRGTKFFVHNLEGLSAFSFKKVKAP